MAFETCDLLCLDLEKAERVRAELPAPDEIALRARRLKLLADPTRLELALALQLGSELCVCDLAWITERAENLASHHLRALRDAGIAHSRREGKMVLYSLTAEGHELLNLTGAVTA